MTGSKRQGWGRGRGQGGSGAACDSWSHRAQQRGTPRPGGPAAPLARAARVHTTAWPGKRSETNPARAPAPHVERRHLPHDVFLERAADRADAHERRGLERRDRLLQGAAVGHVVRKRQLVVLQRRAARRAHLRPGEGRWSGRRGQARPVLAPGAGKARCTKLGLAKPGLAQRPEPGAPRRPTRPF